MSWVDSGAWYVGVAWAIALVTVVALVTVALVQWWRRPRVKWSLRGVVSLERMPAPAPQGGATADAGRGQGRLGVLADLELANVGTGSAFGVETVRCLGGDEQPFTVFEATELAPGRAVRITMRVPDEEHWNSCWIRPRTRINRHRFEAGRRRFAKIPVAETLAGSDDPEATHIRM